MFATVNGASRGSLPAVVPPHGVLLLGSDARFDYRSRVERYARLIDGAGQFLNDGPRGAV
jgi:hypothetical protein